MVRALDRKLIRDLFRTKGLLLAITSIIAVGVMCYVTLQSAYHNLNGAKQDYYRQCRMADFWIDVKKVPLPELADLEDVPGITEIHPRIHFPVTVDLEHVPHPINGAVLSLPDQRRRTINDIVLLRGGYFTDNRNNEVIVNEAFANAHGLKTGEWIRLLMNNRHQELLITGTAISSEFTYLLGPGAVVPDADHFGVFYVKQTFAEDVFNFQGASNQIVGLLDAAARQRPDEVLRRAERVLNDYGVFAATPRNRQASNQYLSGEIRGLGAFAHVLPVIFLAVAAVVLNVLMTRLARTQRVVVGTLKALGYTDWQVFGHFLKFGLSVGIAGAILGSLLGYLLATGMTAVYRLFFEFPNLQSEFYPYIHAIGLAVSLLCAALGSLNGARSVLRLQPAEAMRPEPPGRGAAVWMERVPAFWSILNSRWRMTLRSIVRHKIRTAAAVFAAAMGAGLLTNGFMMLEAQNYLIDFQFQRVVRSDIDIALKGERGEAALVELRQIPGVDYVEPTFNLSCTLVHGPYRRKGAITGLVPGARLTVPRNQQGLPIRVPDVGLVMNRRLAGILHLRRGDLVTVEPVQGERRPVEATVAKITDGYLGLTVYADQRYLHRLVGEQFAMNGAQLLVTRDPGQLDQLYHEVKQLPKVQSVTRRWEMIQSLNDTILKNQLIFIGVILMFAGVIFLGSIANASLVTLAERQREVATLAAMGYTPWEIGGLFLRETLTTNLVGVLLGFPIGYLLVTLTARAYESDLMRLPVVSAPWIWLGTFVTAIGFVLVAHSFVQWKIHRMDYLESLKSQE